MASGIELIISSICNATFCQPVYDNPLLETQTSHLDQYKDLIEEINGKHLKIGTFNNRPLSWVETGDNGTLIGRGVSFILVEILQKRFNFTYEVVVPEKNFEMGGTKPEDSLIGLVNHSLVDVAAAFIPKLTRFYEKVRFSYDLDEGVWVMMLRRPKESAAGSGLLAPFNSAVWYLILVAVLSYGPCITLLTKLRSKLVPDGEKFIPMSPSFWFVYGAFIKQGTTLAPEAIVCSNSDQICCLVDDSERCRRPAGNAAYSKRIQKTVMQRKLKLNIDPQARHTYICDYHKNMIQCARTKQRRPKDSEDDSNEAEMDSPEVDWFQLQVSTLRRYKKHYKVPTRPGLNKALLADAIQKHFKTLPVNEKEIMTYFIYMVKTNGNKLDQKNGMNSDSV